MDNDFKLIHDQQMIDQGASEKTNIDYHRLS